MRRVPDEGCTSPVKMRTAYSTETSPVHASAQLWSDSAGCHCSCGGSPLCQAPREQCVFAGCTFARLHDGLHFSTAETSTRGGASEGWLCPLFHGSFKESGQRLCTAAVVRRHMTDFSASVALLGADAECVV